MQARYALQGLFVLSHGCRESVNLRRSLAYASGFLAHLSSGTLFLLKCRCRYYE
jgi:hypothetical protein